MIVILGEYDEDWIKGSLNYLKAIKLDEMLQFVQHDKNRVSSSRNKAIE